MRKYHIMNLLSNLVVNTLLKWKKQKSLAYSWNEQITVDFLGNWHDLKCIGRDRKEMSLSHPHTARNI